MTETIYFAGGCFWGTEHFMRQIKGVVGTETGYANSLIENPTYNEVCSGLTHAAEAVKVTYDPRAVTVAQLTRLYAMTIDPTAINRQGNDRGTQYRTGIYFTTEEQAEEVAPVLAALEKRVGRPLAVEFSRIENFYGAEEYHQKYLEKNPSGYCHIDPRLFKYARELNRRASSVITAMQQPASRRMWM